MAKVALEQLASPAEASAPAAQPGFPVVGIGASAGGFQALSALLEAMPANAGMAIVVILHLAADGPSNADRLLQRATGMPVVQVTHTMPILPGEVYVIPPDRSLRMREGQLVLDELERGTPGPVAIDIFMRTLAEAHGARAVGVVLSGMGSDGTAGLARIKELGGATIAQQPEEAAESSMPRTAIASGVVDFVLAARDIPRKLLELRDRCCAPAPPAAEALGQVLEVLRAQTGHDFGSYRPPTLQRRLARRLQLRGLPDLAAYCRLLREDSAEAPALLKDLLIGVTGFFRDREAFAFLDRAILPGLFAAAPRDRPLRAWIAACSTGEEAYTVAMLLAARAETAGVRLQVFASDIDEQAIEAARAGSYPASAAGQVPPPLLERYFTREGEGYKVRKALRDLVLFARHDLLCDPMFGRIDLLSCRNLLIYLQPDMQRRLLRQFHFALNPGGILMLGADESAEGEGTLFEPTDAAQRIYRARPARQGTAGPDPQASCADPGSLAASGSEPEPSAMRRGRLYSFADIHLHKSAGLAPPSILVDARGDILHVAEAAVRFLRPAGGEPTRELATLLAPELRLPLRAALLQAAKGGATRTGPLRHARHAAVDLEVLPFNDQHAEGELMLVQFHEADGAAPPPALQEQDLARQLDEELRQTRRQLLEGVERAEASADEMRVYSEEMQTTVEELRARADEAERERDMLAARGRELDAENRALRQRAEEADKAHDDLANLIASSGVATIFLDRAMRIVRFTPRVADFFNVIDSDIGRPLLHITNSFDDPALAEDAAAVFDTLQAMEREVRGKDGRDYIVRVHPYRTTAHLIDGAVMTFFDVTERKRIEQAQRVNDARLAALFESLPVAVGVFDDKGDATMFNHALRRFLPESGGLPRDPDSAARWRSWSAEGRPLGPGEFPGARALRGERVVPGVEMLYTDDSGRQTWTQVASSPVIGTDGRVAGQCLVITDIDALKRSEEALRENEGRLLELAGEFAQVVWETDAGGMVRTDSPSWRAYTGQTWEEWLGMGWLDAVHPDDRAHAARQWAEAVAASSMVNAHFRVRRADGQWRLMAVRAAPMVGADGRIRKWVGLDVELNEGAAPS